MKVSRRATAPRQTKFLKEANPDYTSYPSAVHLSIGLGLPLLMHEVKR
jgi:hypothetical protein